MARIKIEELAQKYGVTPKELLQKLKKSGWTVNTLFSLVDEKKVAELFKPKGVPENSRVVIKKYENRRFYSTSASKHVTLEEIKNMIKDGVDLEVVDAVNDQDITSEVMAQILLESGRFRFLPTQMLRDMIRFEDQALMHFLERYFSVGLDLYNQSQKEMGKLYQSFLPTDGWMSTLKNPFLSEKMTGVMSQWASDLSSQLGAQWLAPFSGQTAMRNDQTQSPSRAEAEEDAGQNENVSAPTSSDADVQALRRELEVLRSKVSLLEEQDLPPQESFASSSATSLNVSPQMAATVKRKTIRKDADQAKDKNKKATASMAGAKAEKRSVKRSSTK